MDVEYSQIVKSLGKGAFVVDVPDEFPFKWLVGLRHYIKGLANEEGRDKIAILYLYPPRPINMPDFGPSDQALLNALKNETEGIYYDTVIYVNAHYHPFKIPYAMLVLYSIIHIMYPIFGRTFKFAKDEADGHQRIQKWQSKQP